MEQHDLIHELPEFKAKVEALRVSDAQFARIVDEYEEANRHVVSVESNVEPATDFALEDMKKRRLKLKDRLYDILKGGSVASVT